MVTYQVLFADLELFSLCTSLGFYPFPSKKNKDPIRRGAGPDTALAEVLVQLFSDLINFHT